MLMTKLIGAGFSVATSDGGGAVSIGFVPSAVRDRRLVATMRQLAGEQCSRKPGVSTSADSVGASRSEEHTSELQSRLHLVCRLLLEKKNKKKRTNTIYILHSVNSRSPS